MIRTPHQRPKLIANALLASALLACAVLLLYPPASSRFYPSCPIRDFFGIECPGCGATRALAALLRGHILEALRLNALFVVLLPAALAAAGETYRRAIRPESFRWPKPPVSVLCGTLACAAIFTFARNLLP